MLFPARPSEPGLPRLVRFDPELCTGCAICRFRCTARAIEFRAGKGDFVWSYDPGHCTFAAAAWKAAKPCADQDAECPPIYLNIGDLKNSYTSPARRPLPSQPLPPAGGCQPTTDPALEVHNDRA